MFRPQPYPNLDPYLFRPVAAGLWTHAQAIDGTFSFEDLMDANELLDVKEKNAADYADWKAARGDNA